MNFAWSKKPPISKFENLGDMGINFQTGDLNYLLEMRGLIMSLDRER
jgi:hypothetical protein